MDETPEERVFELYKAIDAQDEDQVRALLHPETKAQMMMANGRFVEGREAVIETMRRASRLVFRITAQKIERLDADAFLVTGRIRAPTEAEGYADRPAVWVTDWKDGMIIGQQIYGSGRPLERPTQLVDGCERVTVIDPLRSRRDP